MYYPTSRVNDLQIVEAQIQTLETVDCNIVLGSSGDRLYLIVA